MVGLFRVPGAAVGGAQTFHDGDEALHLKGRLAAFDHFSVVHDGAILIAQGRMTRKIPLYPERFFLTLASMEVHAWKERTEEGTLVYRACHHAGKWKLECAPKVGRAERDDVEWERVELTRAHWVTLRDVLWRKYQRKRCPWRFIETIDKLLEEMPEEEDADFPDGRDGR